MDFRAFPYHAYHTTLTFGRLEACQHKNGFILADGTCAELPRPFEQATADDLADGNCGDKNSGQGVIYNSKLYVCDGSQGTGEWLELPEAPLGSSEISPAASCTDVYPQIKGKYFVGSPGNTGQVYCDLSTDAAGNSVMVNRGGDGSSKEAVAASCGTIASLWNIREPAYYFVHKVVQKGVEVTVKVNCNGKASSGGDGQSARSYAASCSDLDDHFIKLPDGKYWVATDTTPRFMTCLRSSDDGQMYEVPDGLSRSAAAESCAAIKEDYPDIHYFQDSYLKKKKSGSISQARCLTVACDSSGVAAKDTSVETKCPTSVKSSAVEVATGETKATAAPSCVLLATAYSTASSAPYWIAAPDKDPSLKECVITRTGTKLTAAELPLLGLTKGRPAASCASLGQRYTSWGTEKTGVYWIGSSQRGCVFTGKGASKDAADGKSSATAFVSCNDAMSVLGKTHRQHVGTVWVKPHASVRPVNTVYLNCARAYSQKHTFERPNNSANRGAVRQHVPPLDSVLRFGLNSYPLMFVCFGCPYIIYEWSPS